MDSIGYDIDQVLQKFPGLTSVGFVDELHDSKLACLVYANKKIKLAFADFHLGDINMKKPIGVISALSWLWPMRAPNVMLEIDFFETALGSEWP